MATSIADLLTLLDAEMKPGSAHDPRDVGRALDVTSRLLDRLRTDGVGADTTPFRDDVVRRLAESCGDAAACFDAAPGRVSDIIGVTGDAVGQLHQHLTAADRWAVAISLAATSRHCARILAESGPYDQVPELLAVADRSRELIRAAATSPPDPDDLIGHDIPIPAVDLPDAMPPARVVAESTTELVAMLRRGGRDPMTIRQLIGICVAAAELAGLGEAFAAATGHAVPESAALAWQSARQQIARFADRPSTIEWDGNRILHTAARVQEESATVRRHADVTRYDMPCLRAAVAHLPRLAAGCEHEMRAVVRTLVVARGPAPLHEGRIGEWLRREAFTAMPTDLVPATVALRQAGTASEELAVRLGPTRSRIELYDRKHQVGIDSPT